MRDFHLRKSRDCMGPLDWTWGEGIRARSRWLFSPRLRRYGTANVPVEGSRRGSKRVEGGRSESKRDEVSRRDLLPPSTLFDPLRPPPTHRSDGSARQL